MTVPVVIVTNTPEETRTLGVTLADMLVSGDVILLHGDLGAGKTTLTQGLAAGLRVLGPVQSPTFTLVNEYRSASAACFRLYHLDLYRLDGPEDLDDIGYDDLLAPTDGMTVIEWPERAGDVLPDDALIVQIEQTGPGQRTITIRPLRATGQYADRVAQAVTRGQFVADHTPATHQH